jgi:hypothetical protein
MGNIPVKTVVTAQDLTASYVDFGSPVNVSGNSKLGVHITADVNDSLNVDLKVIALHTSGGSEFEVDGYNEIRLWGATVADFKKEYLYDCAELNFVQFQAKAGTVGSTAGDLTIEITKPN